MKRFLLYLLTVATIVACSKSDDVGGGNNNNNETPKQPEITLNATASNFASDGGSSEITFTTSAAWTAEVINTRADAWCSVNPTSGAAGDAKITVTTTANDTPDDRSASIVIKAGTASKTITVSQKQKDALTVTASKFEIGAEGGEVSIEVKANIDFEYAIEESAKDWVEYKTTRALKSSNLVFDIKENELEEKREARITIKSGEFSEDITIYQAGAEPTIVISQNEYVVSSDGDTIAVDVASNIDVSVELPADADWISENTTRGMSTNTFYFDIAPSEEYDQRTADIKFTNKENSLSEVVKIVQTQKDAIVLAENEYVFGVAGGNLDFEILTNVDITISISDDAKSWIKQVESRGLEKKALYFNVSACSAEEDREGTITILGGDATQVIVVKQLGLKQTLDKEREALIAFYKATGGDNWTNNTNWCSDMPVSEWYGVDTDYKTGRITRINLEGNNLNGEIKEELKSLSELIQLNIRDNKIKKLDINYLTKLRELNCTINQLTELDVSKLVSLINLSCGANQLTELDVSNLHKLFEFNCSENMLSKLDVSNLINLEHFYCGNNQLTKLDVSNLTRLINLHFEDNQLTEIDVSNLTSLERFTCSSNQLTELNVSNLKELRYLSCFYNQLSGEIPRYLENMSKLEWLDISYNNFSGELPAWLGNLPHLEHLIVMCNQLTGKIPESIMRFNWWGKGWMDVLPGNNFSKDGLIIPAPKLNNKTIDGKTIDSSIYAENEYTVLYQYYDWCGYSSRFTPELIKLYNRYKGLEVIAFSYDRTIDVDDPMSQINYHKRYAEFYDTKWPYIITNDENEALFNTFFWTGAPSVCVVDKNGYIVFNPLFDNYMDLEAFLIDKMGDGNTDDTYYSTDYSKDGEVKQLQKATEGKGIDLVLMGDAYTDRLIADGTYDQVMQTAMEKFFEVEPYKSFRDHFNVYSVTAVSKNEFYTNTSETAFAGYFGSGTYVGGNNQRAFYFAQKAIGEERVEDALVVVMMNSTAYAGTCYIYSPSYGDWGNGATVAYFPVGKDEDALAQVLHHEAGGHGFTKLGDEYSYENMGEIPALEIEDVKALSVYGWRKNVDFTSDPTKVKWSHFLADERYANDGLGVYEGALRYWTGAYRPTMNSIMNANVGGFNAPSREAIYYRIHKLAYGADWKYDYEEFVEWDAKNRATTTRGVPYRLEIPEDFKPLHPPVVMMKSWKEATNNAPKKTVTRSSGNAGSNLQKVISPSGTTYTFKPTNASASYTTSNGRTVTVTTDVSGMSRTGYNNRTKK